MTTKEIRKEYGSIKQALEYCRDFPMNKAQTREQLGIGRYRLDRFAEQFKITFKGGEIQRRDKAKAALIERSKQPHFHQMSPIEHNGQTWYPGEPKFHYLRSLKK